MKSDLTNKLEAALDMADKTVKESKNYIGAVQLRTNAMATHYLISEALAVSKKLDEKPAPSDTPPVV